MHRVFERATLVCSFPFFEATVEKMHTNPFEQTALSMNWTERNRGLGQLTIAVFDPCCDISHSALFFVILSGPQGMLH
jgi:hypothetical protein